MIMYTCEIAYLNKIKRNEGIDIQNIKYDHWCKKLQRSAFFSIMLATILTLLGGAIVLDVFKNLDLNILVVIAIVLLPIIVFLLDLKTEAIIENNNTNKLSGGRT